MGVRPKEGCRQYGGEIKPMIVAQGLQTISLENDNGTFRPKSNDEESLGCGVSYHNVIGALMYLTNCIRYDIQFEVSLVARHNANPSICTILATT